MSLLEALVLGVIQGLTEFLPISSSGHLVLIEKIFGIEAEGTMSFNIALHIATFLPVLWIFREDVLAIIRKPFSSYCFDCSCYYPTVIIAVVFSNFIENAFVTGSYLGICFIVTGLALWLAESVDNKTKRCQHRFLPGCRAGWRCAGDSNTSGNIRSGFTIAGALLRKFDRAFALKFSFLLSIPAIVGAALKEGYGLYKSGLPLTGDLEIFTVLVGMAAAAASGYLAIKFMINVLKRGSLKIFSYYVFTLGVFVLIDQFLTRVVF